MQPIKSICIILPIILHPLCVFAQEVENVVDTDRRNWSISFNIGGTVGGPAGDIEDAMILADFDKRSPGFFGPGKKHPFSDPQPSWVIGVNYFFKRPFTIGMLFSNTHIRKTRGYHSQASYLWVDSSVITIAPILSVNNEIIRIGMGPALHIAQAWNSRSNAIASQRGNYTRFGFIINLGLRVPEDTRFFGEFNILYRKVGTATIGPFTATGLADFTAILPATKVNYNHLFIGLGFGIRM